MTAAPRRTMSWPCSVIRTRTLVVELGERARAEGLDGLLREGAVEKFGGAGEHDLRHDRVRRPRGRARCRAAPPRRGGSPRALRSRMPRASRDDQRGHRQPGLEASDLAAGALRTAVGADGDVADLTGGEAAAAHGLAAEQQPRADAAADLDQQHVVRSAAERVLREHRRVGVVGHEHREARGRCAAHPRDRSRAQPKFGAVRITPRSSTTPGVPTPMPSTGAWESATSPRASSTTVDDDVLVGGERDFAAGDDAAVERRAPRR